MIFVQNKSKSEIDCRKIDKRIYVFVNAYMTK